MPRLILCDLDGTLISHGKPLTASTIETMAHIQSNGDYVAIASGRSIQSGLGVMPHNMPISYWIFSTGAGIMDWKTREIICRNELEANDVRTAVDVLLSLREDFMVQETIPQNHRFIYRKFTRNKNAGTDFFRRCDVNRQFCHEATDDELANIGKASQLIAVIPPDMTRIEAITSRLTNLSCIRATSPMDGHSIWLEIFNQNVGKAKGAQWLADKLGISHDNTFAFGNDYNDLDMLRWAGHSAVTPNAPDELKAFFHATNAETDYAFQEIAEYWKLI